MNHSDLKNHISPAIFLLLLMITLGSCEYEFIEVDLPDPNVEVKFSESILPIFESNNCIACHKPGATAPDLTAANAYNSIVPSYVNLSDPESSKIYTVPLSHYESYTSIQAANVLNWIKQGAENN
jgi:hypothetical protein